jgi:hypothetical protein
LNLCPEAPIVWSEFVIKVQLQITKHTEH